MREVVRRVLGRYLDVSHSRPRSTVLVLLTLTVAAAPLIGHLELRSSLRELLPKDSPSVRALERVVQNVGGVGTILLVIQSPDKLANERFADAMAAGLAKLPAGTLRSIEYRIDAIKDFYEEHALYYLGLDELTRLERRLNEGYKAARRQANPLHLDLDEEDDVPAADGIDITKLDELEAKKTAELSPMYLVDDYYGVDEGRCLAMVVRPFGSNLSVGASRELLGRLAAVATGLDPKSFHAELTLGMTGSVVTAIEEYETLKADMLSTALLCIGLVMLSIVAFFRRLRPALLLGITLVVGLAWTLTLAELTIGYFNAQTAFLGSIIIGTGINYGIILLGRYYEERRKGERPQVAMRRAVEVTARPTLIAAITTAVAFAVLLVGGIRSLWQFGLIGSSGILLSWLATMTVLPVLTLVSEELLDSFLRPPPAAGPSRAITGLARLIGTHPRIVAGSFLFAVIGSLAAMARFAPDAIEYDFSKLRNRTSIQSGTDKLDRRVGKVFKNSTVPTVIHLDSLEQAIEVTSVIAQRIAAQPEAERYVASTTSIADVLPKDEEAKLPILARIRDLLTTQWIGHLEGRAKERVVRMRDALDGRALTVADLPAELARSFEDKQGRRGTVVYVNPSKKKYFSDGHNLIGFANTIRHLELADGTVIDAAGDPTVFAELIEIISQQAPFLTLAAFVAVLGIIVAAMRDRRRALVLIVTLVAGILIMMGVCALMQIRVNFFNFIIVPLTIGIGVDYSVNVMARLTSDREHSLAHMLRHTGGAVLLCSLTTIIGYFVLTRANNQALASFGVAAIIGEVTCVVAALILTPTLFTLFASQSASAPAPASASALESTIP